MENTNLSDLNNQTLAQLRQTAKELNIKSVTKYKKAELIEQIKEHANKLKSNDDVLIENLKSIKQHPAAYVPETEISDFDCFRLYDTQYTFIGDKSLLISGSDILFVTFEG